MSPEPTLTPSIEPADLTLENLVSLVDAAAEADKQESVMVIAVYTLPKNAGIETEAEHKINPARPLGFNGIPPGGRSAIYHFPLPDPTKLHDKKEALRLLDQRFKSATEVQAVAAMSNVLYAEAVHPSKLREDLSED